MGNKSNKKNKKTFVRVTIAAVMISAIAITVFSVTMCCSSGKSDAQIIDSRWTVDGHYYTDEESENSQTLLNESLEAEYYSNDGSQTINYYVFDVSDEDIDHIPFISDKTWEEKEEIAKVLTDLNISEDKKPRGVDKSYRLSDKEDDGSLYIWLLLNEDKGKLYVLEMLR